MCFQVSHWCNDSVFPIIIYVNENENLTVHKHIHPREHAMWGDSCDTQWAGARNSKAIQRWRKRTDYLQ